MITITQEAANKVKQLMSKEPEPVKLLRVGVRGGGCSGFSYSLEFSNETKENDIVVEAHGLTVVCDPKSLKFLEEVELYYDTNLLGGGFKFRNPNAQRTCSCGESFSV